MRLSKWNLLALSYFLGGIGVFVTIAGGSWDITRHSLGLVDTFFTTAHLILYSGIGMAALAALGNLRLRMTHQEIPTHLLTGLDMLAIGTAVQLVAGPFDFWWHSTFGFDPVLLSPPHAMLILGIALNSVAMSLGAARLYKHTTETHPETGFLWKPSSLKLLLALAFTAMWASLNVVIYLFTIDTFTRAAITSIITTPAALLLLACTAPLVLFTASRFVKSFGFITLIGLLFMAVNIFADLIPRTPYFQGMATFTALYPLLILPILAADYLLARAPSEMRTQLLAGAILGIPVVLLYYPMSFAYWLRGPGGMLGALAILAVPDALFGALGAVFSQNFYNFFNTAVPQLPIISSIGMKQTTLKTR